MKWILVIVWSSKLEGWHKSSNLILYMRQSKTPKLIKILGIYPAKLSVRFLGHCYFTFISWLILSCFILQPNTHFRILTADLCSKRASILDFSMSNCVLKYQTTAIHKHFVTVFYLSIFVTVFTTKTPCTFAHTIPENRKSPVDHTW